MCAAKLAVVAAALSCATAQLSVQVATQDPLYRLARPYLNFNIDTGSIYNGFDFKDIVLTNLVYALNNGDVVFRIGGTAADYSFYNPTSTDPNGGNGTTIISNSILDDLFFFAASTHATIMWDFNGLAFRKPNADGSLGPWDPTGNATAMLAYLDGKYGGAINWAWSLGNEPGFWKQKVNATQLGQDALLLSETLKKYHVGYDVYGAAFGGLDTEPVAEFLNSTKGNIAGITVHNYPLARDCTVDAYLNRSHIDTLGASLAKLTALKKSLGHPNTVLVLEETAGSYGGGCENISDRFVSGFSYMATIGIVASNGIGRMHRQDFAGWSFTGGMSHYQLAGPPGWTRGSALLRPHPDWYTSVLFKQMTGTSMLAATLTSSAGPSDPLLAQVSVFAWCSGAAWWDNEAMVLSWSNPTGADVTVTFAAQGISSVPRMEYMMTSSASAYFDSRARIASNTLITSDAPLAPPASLQDDVAFLNGALLSVDDNGNLPWQNGAIDAGREVKDPNAPMVFPPFSYGFIEYPGAGPHAC